MRYTSQKGWSFQVFQDVDGDDALELPS
jgi:hypothetical protein